MDWDRLVAAAVAVRANAYAPYSGFPVGAALLMEDGSIWAGANVENCIPSLATCAERNALTAALSAGLRKPRALAVITDMSPPARPCGLCRQSLSEFAEGDLPILVTNTQGEREETTLVKLLPDRFYLRFGPPGEESPQRGEESPQRGEGSPQRGEESPQRGEGSPSKGEGSPSKGEGSPQRGEGSPSKGEGSP